MKKNLLIFTIVILLALDWAVLDDVTTGKEPDKRLELAIVLVGVPLLFVLGKELLKSHKRDRT